MGTVYKKHTTRPFPELAELFTRSGEQFERWKDKCGRTRTAKVTTGNNGTLRIITESSTFFAKFRDGQSIVQEVATGCRTKDRALSVLRGLTNQVEKVRAGILTPTEATIAAQAAMRHSRIDLTMNVYTDPKLLDVHGALDALPKLPLDAAPQW